VNDFWDIAFTQESGQERPYSFGVAVAVKEDIEHEPVLVHGSPQPTSNTINARTDLVQKPARTPTGFLLAQFYRKVRPGPPGHSRGSVGTAALGVLDDGHRKTVVVELDSGHGRSAYPEPVKATPPLNLLALP